MNHNDNLARLRFLCRRGMKEVEDILFLFLEQYYTHLTFEQQQQFFKLLQCEDPQLWDWLVIKNKQPDAKLQDIVTVINDHAI